MTTISYSMSRQMALLATVTLVILGLFTSGCTSIKTYPLIARAGDTITIAVGSPNEMKRQAGTTVEYIYDAGGSVDLTPYMRAVFKIYPDKTSAAWLDDDFIEILSDQSGHGPWQQVMAIDLPTSMTEGTGYIEVTTGGGQYSGQPHVNDYQIALEILPASVGLGESNTFDHPVVPGSQNTIIDSLTKLEPLKQVSVRPPRFPSMSTTYGAIEFVLDFPVTTDDGDGDGSNDPVQVYVIKDDYGSRDLNSQVQTLWSSNGNETRVMMIAPNGMSVKQSRFNIVGATRSPMGTVTTLENTTSPVITSVSYYDLAGNETTVAPAKSEYVVKLAFDF